MFKRVFKAIPGLIVLLAFLFLVAYLALFALSDVYVSGGRIPPGKSEGLGVEEIPGLNYIYSLNLPGIKKPKMNSVERVNAGHALRNALFLMIVSCFAALIPIACFVLIPICLLLGLFTADWDVFLGGVLLLPMGGLALIVVPLGLLALWLLLLFQPCTPGYVVVWLLVGLPFTALGALIPAAPTSYVIIIKD